MNCGDDVISTFVIRNISKNGISCSFNSYMNRIFLSKMFKTALISSTVPHFLKHTMSSTYLHQYVKTSHRSGIKLYFQFNHENIRQNSSKWWSHGNEICSCASPLNTKCTFFVQRNIFKVFLTNYAWKG